MIFALDPEDGRHESPIDFDPKTFGKKLDKIAEKLSK